MEPEKLGVKEFFDQVGRPIGLSLDFVEVNCKKAMKDGTDWSINVGIRPDHYVVPLDDIRSYFEEKNRPKPAPVEVPLAKEFVMDDDEVFPAAEGKKGDGKK